MQENNIFLDLSSNTAEAIAARKAEEVKKYREKLAQGQNRASPASGYTNLKEINLEHELVNLFNQTKQFLADCLILDPAEAPINQIAQAINTCNAVLKEIVKSQEEVYSQEKVKTMEGVLLEVLKKQPKEIQQQFLQEYELALRQAVKK